MHPLIRSQITLACFAFLLFASGMRNVAFGHEGHQMECTKTSMQAVKADIQAMNNGEFASIPAVAALLLGGSLL